MVKAVAAVEGMGVEAAAVEEKVRVVADKEAAEMARVAVERVAAERVAMAVEQVAKEIVAEAVRYAQDPKRGGYQENRKM